ncbi:MAG: hypothetical protein ACTSUW_02375 [Candidatus Heimdallarchaeota archaeon]
MSNEFIKEETEIDEYDDIPVSKFAVDVNKESNFEKKDDSLQKHSYYSKTDFKKRLPYIIKELKEATENIFQTLNCVPFTRAEETAIRKAEFKKIRKNLEELSIELPDQTQGYQGASKEHMKAYKITMEMLSTIASKFIDVNDEISVRNTYLTVLKFVPILQYLLDYMIGDRKRKEGKKEFELEKLYVNSKFAEAAVLDQKKSRWQFRRKNEDWEEKMRW